MWMDLEMTGLDVEGDVIVELAVLATDEQLTPLDDGLDLVVHHPDEVLERMDDFVRKMHERSGLLTEIQSSNLELGAAGTQILSYIKQHAPKARTIPLCGNSIGMDRRFLSRYLPEIEEQLHYRSIDVSSLKELCKRWYPEAYKQRPDKAQGHRALADIHESINELRYYRESILR